MKVSVWGRVEPVLHSDNNIATTLDTTAMKVSLWGRVEPVLHSDNNIATAFSLHNGMQKQHLCVCGGSWLHLASAAAL